jgi:ribosomal protein S18 acetylase RimI-like enzyme
MAHVNLSRGQYRLTTDPKKFDVDAIRAFLGRTGKSWARGIPRRIVAKSIKHSLCFGLLHGRKQIGFARVVTDRATYAYLCDVYILEEYQARGLGTWMIEAVMGHPDLQGLRRFQLVTRDAHGLYRRFGFGVVKSPEYHMEIFRPGLYLEVKNDRKTDS